MVEGKFPACHLKILFQLVDDSIIALWFYVSILFIFHLLLCFRFHPLFDFEFASDLGIYFNHGMDMVAFVCPDIVMHPVELRPGVVCLTRVCVLHVCVIRH